MVARPPRKVFRWHNKYQLDEHILAMPTLAMHLVVFNRSDLIFARAYGAIAVCVVSWLTTLLRTIRVSQIVVRD